MDFFKSELTHLRQFLSVESCQMLRIMSNARIVKCWELSNVENYDKWNFKRHCKCENYEIFDNFELVGYGQKFWNGFCDDSQCDFFVEFKWRNDYMCAEGQALGFNLFLIMRAVICMWPIAKLTLFLESWITICQQLSDNLSYFRLVGRPTQLIFISDIHLLKEKYKYEWQRSSSWAIN